MDIRLEPDHPIWSPRPEDEGDETAMAGRLLVDDYEPMNVDFTPNSFYPDDPSAAYNVLEDYTKIGSLENPDIEHFEMYTLAILHEYFHSFERNVSDLPLAKKIIDVFWTTNLDHISRESIQKNIRDPRFSKGLDDVVALLMEEYWSWEKVAQAVPMLFARHFSVCKDLLGTYLSKIQRLANWLLKFDEKEFYDKLSFAITEVNNGLMKLYSSTRDRKDEPLPQELEARMLRIYQYQRQKINRLKELRQTREAEMQGRHKEADSRLMRVLIF